ncbi:hypothetical protein HDV05_002203 [Chytridiales sp. JEL 0842]|nr:hypothetical protein HDV05_002203 [Chytridiales sp. JEL 0842]
MVLNALGVDPLRKWKGCWRWWDEEVLEVCQDRGVILQEGITMPEFECFATCNGLKADIKLAHQTEKELFLNDLRNCTSSQTSVLVVSYNRGTLQQTGTGHFSPVGGYNEAAGKVLIFDVARFKYPAYWVDVDLLWEALHPIDEATGYPRGYAVLSKAPRRGIIHSALAQLTERGHEPFTRVAARFMADVPSAVYPPSPAFSPSAPGSSRESVTITDAATLNAITSSLGSTSASTSSQDTTTCIKALNPIEAHQKIHELIQKLRPHFSAISQTPVFEPTTVDGNTPPPPAPATCDLHPRVETLMNRLQKTKVYKAALSALSSDCSSSTQLITTTTTVQDSSTTYTPAHAALLLSIVVAGFLTSPGWSSILHGTASAQPALDTQSAVQFLVRSCSQDVITEDMGEVEELLKEEIDLMREQVDAIAKMKIWDGEVRLD